MDAQSLTTRHHLVKAAHSLLALLMLACLMVMPRGAWAATSLAVTNGGFEAHSGTSCRPATQAPSR